MNELKIFSSEEFGNVRTIEIEGKPYFMASDIAKALGYARPNDAVSAHCRAAVKRSTHISGKMQEVNFIPEGDVYRLIVRSQLPSAEKFERWVMDEVLPSIRQNGMYAMNDLSPELRLLISMEMKQKQQEKEMLSMKADMKRLEAKVTTHNDDYYTIAGYASLRGLNVDISRANMLGRKASKLSKEYGYETAKTKDSRFGTVNTYHSDVLKEAFRDAV